VSDYTIRQPTVQARARWAGPWKSVAHLRCTRAVAAAAPSVPAASFAREYGWIDDRHREPMETMEGQFVRVLDRPGGDVIWLGVVAADADAPFAGADAGVAGDQGLQAFGLEHLLARADVYGSFCLIENQAVHIATPLNFNGARADAAGLVGNRSANKHGGTYLFSSEGELWTARDVAEYLLGRFAPPALSLTLTGQLDNLETVAEAWAAPRNVHQGLCRVIDRRRGSGWYVDFRQSPPKVFVFSVFAPGDVAGGVQPNTAVADYDAAGTSGAGPVEIRLEAAHRYDEVSVRGGAIVQCCSVGTAQLKPAWPQTLEDEYRQIDEETPAETDAARADERYRDVFRTYRMGGDVHTALAPAVADDGTITLADRPVWWHEKPLLQRLPLLAGYDYELGQPASLGGEPTGEYRSPFAVVQDGDARWGFVHSPPAADDPAETLPPAHLYMMPNAIGVRLQVRPAYVYALNHWDEDAGEGLREPLRDYETLVFTVAFAADDRLRVTRKIGNRPTDAPSRLVIDVPDAQAHILHENTTVGIKADGVRKRTPRMAIIRDDTPRLRRIADLAAAWYARTRRAASITLPFVAREADGAGVGVLMRQITAGGRSIPVGSPVTSVAYRFGDDMTTTVASDYAELDWAAMGPPGGADAAAAANPMAVGLTVPTTGVPARLADPAAGGGGDEFDAIITASEAVSTNPPRWTYTLKKAHKTAAGPDGWEAVEDAEELTPAYNDLENGGVADGFFANGVHKDDLDPDEDDDEEFTVMAVQNDVVVRARRVTIAGGESDAEYAFAAVPNGTHGKC